MNFLDLPIGEFALGRVGNHRDYHLYFSIKSIYNIGIRVDTFSKNGTKIGSTLGYKSGCVTLAMPLNQSQYVLLLVCIKAVTSKSV